MYLVVSLTFPSSNGTATTDIDCLSLHDALPISAPRIARTGMMPIIRSTWGAPAEKAPSSRMFDQNHTLRVNIRGSRRSEEHTSELQSLAYLVCRLLLAKSNTVSPDRDWVSGRIT